MPTSAHPLPDLETLDLAGCSARERDETLGAALASATADRLEHLLAEPHAEAASRQAEVRLATLDAGARDELEAFAAGAGCAPASLLALRLRVGGGDHGPLGRGLCTALHVPAGDEVLLGMSVNGGALSAGAVLVRHSLHGRVVIRLLGAGGLCWGGLSDAGVGVITAHPPWPARLPDGRVTEASLARALAPAHATAARDEIVTGDRREAGYWIVSDAERSFGIETAPERSVVTRRGARVAHVHTDHFFDVGLRFAGGGQMPPRSARRMEIASSIFVQRQPEGVLALFQFLRELDQVSGATGDRGSGDADVSILGPAVKFVAQCRARRVSACWHGETVHRMFTESTSDGDQTR